MCNILFNFIKYILEAKAMSISTILECLTIPVILLLNKENNEKKNGKLEGA